MPSVLTVVSLANCFSQSHGQIQPFAPPPMFMPAPAYLPEMQYAQPMPQQFAQAALQQFAQPAQPMAPQQFAQPAQPMAPREFAPRAQPMAPPFQQAVPIPRATGLEPPPFRQAGASLQPRFDAGAVDVSPPQQMLQLAGGQQVQQYVVPAEPPPPEQQLVPATQQPQQLQQQQQQQQPEAKSEENPLEDLPDVELMPKPPATLEFTKDPVAFRAQRDAYDQSVDEYMQHLHWEFENVRLLAVQRKDDIKSDIDARIELQVNNHEELLELEFERQQGLLAQHFETKTNQLQSKVDKERAAQQEQALERLKASLEKVERTREEQLEAIRAAAEKESGKFNQAKDLIIEYNLDMVSNEVDITSDVQVHADNYENVLRLKMEELQEAPSDDPVN